MYLPNEILQKIYQYVALKDLPKIALVNNFGLQIAKQLFPERFLKEHFPPVIRNLLSFKQKKEIQYLPYQDSFMGYTDYLDGIRVEDLDTIDPNRSIFMGVDKYNRSFISLKLDIMIGKQTIQDIFNNIIQISDQHSFMDLVRSNNVKEAIVFRFVNTIFQRYRYDKKIWCIGSWYNLMDFTNTRLYEDDFDIYKNIIQSDTMVDFNQEDDSGMQYSVTLANNCNIKSNFLTKKYKVCKNTGDLQKFT